MADTEGQNKLNAGLRYAGSSLGTVFAMMGAFALISPDQAAQLSVAFHQLSDSIITGYGALLKMWVILGPVAVFWLGKVGVQSSSVQAIKNKLLSIASGPASPSAVEAQKAAIQVTAAVAMDKSIPASEDAKNTLVAATIALPEVQTIVTDAKTAAASPSSSVIAAPITRAS